MLWAGTKAKLRSWALKSRKPEQQHILDRRNLFIVPSASGLALLLVMALVWLLGTNYDNNLVLALAFFMASVLIVSILQTHSSLSGLSISLVKTQPCFMRDETVVQLRLERRGEADYPDIRINWLDHHPAQYALEQSDPLIIDTLLTGFCRGRMALPMLKVESRFPLGLVRCWTWLRFDGDVLVYPSPVNAGSLPASTSTSDTGQEQLVMQTGAEDFSGFHDHRQGESLRHVSWKHYARGKGMLVKEYQAYSDRSLWIDWEFLPGLDREARLQRLCYWVLQFANSQQPYGLRLPGLEIKPSADASQRQRLLESLALFEYRRQSEYQGQDEYQVLQGQNK